MTQEATASPRTAWGNAGRHYAATLYAESPTKMGANAQGGNRWVNALEFASPGTKETVERTYRQWNTILRDYLRSETALRLSVGEDTQSVPVKVVDGMPKPFADVMRQFDGIEWLLLNRPAVEAAAAGTDFMERRVDEVREKWPGKAGSARASTIRRVRKTAEIWLQRLDGLRAVNKIVGIEEDVLGAYYFRVPEIRLFWVVIGITARALGVSTEALTIVVLAHELAHAYTHLGRDIDNERWDTERFAGTDLVIVEGLAQFYAQVICRRLGPRMPTALQAYEALLEKQSGPYKAHRKWVGDDERGGEIVRVSMIECRSKGLTAANSFTTALRRYRNGVRGSKER